MGSSTALSDRLRAVAGDDARGLLILDRKGAIVFADAAAETFFQRKPGGLAGETIAGILATGEAVEITVRSATGATAATMRVREIEWEGKPHFLATLRDGVAGPEFDLHYRDIVQSSPDLIMVGRAGRVAYINDAGVKLLHAHAPEDVLGRAVIGLFDPAFHQAIAARTARLLETPGGAPRSEERLVALDGTKVDVEVRAVSFLSHGEMVIQIICRDISARKTHERELKTSIERFHQLAEAMPQIVWTSNPGGGIDYASPAFAQYTGMTNGESPGLRWLEAVHAEDRPAAAAGREKGQREGVPYTMEFRVRRHDGEYRWHFVNAVPVRDENGVLVKWFGSAVDVHDRKMSQEAATDLSNRLAATLESITDAFVLLDRDWRVTYMNKEAERLLRTPRQAIMGKVVWDEFKGAETFEAQYRRAVEEDRMVEFDAPYAPLGLWVEVHAYPSKDGLAVYFRDITERRELEARLRQSQRLEAVGQLTGGIAHDFNNLLTVIIGNAELLVDRLDGDIRGIAEMTLLAGERGADLTKHLLAFARKQALQPRATNVNELLAGMNSMLRRTLGEHIEIEFVTGKNVANAFVDSAQLENAVLNLAINARDAMPKGGRLTIEAANAALDNTYAGNHQEVAPGDYVMIAVSDNGAGMTPDIIARAFEPFFTTKEVGKGSGLGLSMVHGFVKQSGGHVKIYSEPGHGTTVKLYLPEASAADADADARTKAEAAQGGDERILVVEDDDQVRDHVAAQLVHLGYRVTAVATGPEALERMRVARFDLLFTDIVMPGGLNGRQLADEALKRQPGLRVLFTSGYTENAIVHHGRLDPGVHLLNKPYRRSDLAVKVRQVLLAPVK